MRLPSIFRKGRPAKRAISHRRLMLEPLEDRRVMAVSLGLSGTVLNITGDDANDTVTFYELPTPVNQVWAQANSLVVGWQDDQGKSGGASFWAPMLTKIVFNGNGGSDVLQNATNPSGLAVFAFNWPMVISFLPPIEAHGGAGKDTLYGGPKGDALHGDDGDDTLCGNGGSDTLIGGRDNDTLVGGSGDDSYYFDNWSLGGGSLGCDFILELPNSGTDELDFFSHIGKVNVDLATTAWQKVSDSLMIQLYNGAAIENVDGTQFKDTIRGNDLDNYIWGNLGNDTLYGMGGRDTLDGGSHNDALYGGAGDDLLVGGSGNDGLFGGSGRNTLWGLSGADRFLVQQPVADNLDLVQDGTSEDATITFKAGDKWWSPEEIERVDQAFAILHGATNNTKLLKLSSGAPMTFTRLSQSAIGDAYNDQGKIFVTDVVMSGSQLKVTGTALHEIGHNWDNFWGAAELPSNVHTSFLALSGWTRTVPIQLGTDLKLLTSYTQISEKAVNDYKDGKWWYKTKADFASTYAKTHPCEDWAESFAATFLQKAGLGWYGSDGNGASAIPDKVNLINTWVVSLTG